MGISLHTVHVLHIRPPSTPASRVSTSAVQRELQGTGLHRLCVRSHLTRSRAPILFARCGRMLVSISPRNRPSAYLTYSSMIALHGMITAVFSCQVNLCGGLLAGGRVSIFSPLPLLIGGMGVCDLPLAIRSSLSVLKVRTSPPEVGIQGLNHPVLPPRKTPSF